MGSAFENQDTCAFLRLPLIVQPRLRACAYVQLLYLFSFPRTYTVHPVTDFSLFQHAHIVLLIRYCTSYNIAYFCSHPLSPSHTHNTHIHILSLPSLAHLGLSCCSIIFSALVLIRFAGSRLLWLHLRQISEGLIFVHDGRTDRNFKRNDR